MGSKDNNKGSKEKCEKPKKNMSIKNAFASQCLSSTSINNNIKSTSTSVVDTESIYKAIDKLESSEVKATFQLMARALEQMHKSQVQVNSTVNDMIEMVDDCNAVSSELSEHVNTQLTKIEDELAVFKNVTEDKIMSVKVQADIRNSKHFLKIFSNDKNKMETITRVNAMVEAVRILEELGLDYGEARIVKAETKYERRNIFGSMKFLKHIVLTFNDFVTAEKVLFDHLSKKKEMEKADKEASARSKTGKYHLEIPSTFEMRKLMSVCRELKNSENIAKVFYGPDCVRAVMKKENENDDEEIPKRFDMSNLHHVDKMRKKFKMKNLHLPSKQIFDSAYWSKKNEEAQGSNTGGNRKRSTKRPLSKSFEKETGPANTKRDKKCTPNKASTQEMDSTNESFVDTDA